jgi:ketol-acid reductoisomerase
MRKVLGGIQDGSFAREWVAEMKAGEGRLVDERRKLHDSQIETVGRRLRALTEREVEEAHGVG